MHGSIHILYIFQTYDCVKIHDAKFVHIILSCVCLHASTIYCSVHTLLLSPYRLNWFNHFTILKPIISQRVHLSLNTDQTGLITSLFHSQYQIKLVLLHNIMHVCTFHSLESHINTTCIHCVECFVYPRAISLIFTLTVLYKVPQRSKASRMK